MSVRPTKRGVERRPFVKVMYSSVNFVDFFNLGGCDVHAVGVDLNVDVHVISSGNSDG